MSIHTTDTYFQPFAGELIGADQSPAAGNDDLRHAVQYAAWWTRKALDLVGAPGAHPGLAAHLAAASAEHDAAERLIELPAGPKDAA